VKLVSNASPLILLSKIDLLGLLKPCFEQTLVPDGVVAEVAMDLPAFIEQQSLSDLGEAYVSGAIGSLHRGELETMLLARERQIPWVAMDDRSARRRAVTMGLRPIGTLGLLVLFQRRGLLEAARASKKLDQLVDQHGLYLSEVLRAEAHRTLIQDHPE
jgi:predicted nucleic acid-binding protein